MKDPSGRDPELLEEIILLKQRIQELERSESERKRAEEALVESERREREEKERLSTLLNSIQDEIWFADTDKRFTLANPSALKEFGLNVSDERHVERLAEGLEVYRPDGSRRPVEEAPPLRALEGEVVRNQGEIIRTPLDDQLRYREVSASPVRDAGGTIIGSISVVRDITERRRVEEALRESEQRLALAASATKIGMFDWNLARKSILWTQTHDTIFGYPPAVAVTAAAITEYDYRRWADRVHPEDLPLVEEASHRCMQDRKPFEIQYRIIWPDGSLHWVETRGIFQYDNAGEAIRMIGVVIDITEHKLIENRLAADLTALIRMHDLSTKLVEAGPLEPVLQEIMEAAVVIVGAEKGTLQLAEDESLHIVAHHGHEPFFLDFFARAENVASVCGEATRRAERVIVEDVETDPLLAGKPSLTVLRQAGVRAVQSTPLIGRKGELLGILTTQWGSPHIPDERDLWRIDLLARQAVDLIEHARNEEALRKAHAELELRVQERTAQLSQAYEELQRGTRERKQVEEQLRQAQKMEAIGTLAGGIAHDFNNILAAILGFTEMAIDDAADRPDAQKDLRNVLKSAMRARDLVKQILSFSRKSSYARSPIHVSPLIIETVQLLRASISSTIEIRLAIDASSDIVLAASVEVQQILMNLAANASLAMEEKGGVLEVSLTDADFTPDSPVFGPDMMPGDYLQLTVKDTGTGMSHEVKRRAFEPFFTTREVGKGTGMGLAVVYGIVNDLQGTITVESEPGRGSTFRVSLPKVKSEPTEEQLQGGKIPGGTERILFVDDEEILVEWAEAALERLGYSVTGLTDSTEALRTFASDPTSFDLVITDQAMPLMAGVQLANELLKIRPDIPIILCTGHSVAISPEKAKEAGVRQFLMKPLARQELAHAIRRALNRDEEE